MDGHLTVRVTLAATTEHIEQIVASKRDWIERKMKQSAEAAKERSAHSLDYGDEVFLLGKPYLITVTDEPRVGFDGSSFYMPPGLSSEQIQENCVRIYKALAASYLPQRASAIASTVGVIPKSVRISSARTRWGSCSSKGVVSLSWHLILAPDILVDYVIIHELAHLVIMNHSKEFWELVASALPDYQMHRKQLQDVQRRMYSENWV